MTSPPGPRRISRQEHTARATLGMPAGHPELITKRPSRAEWRHLTTWLAQMWPNDEYTVIIAEALRYDPPAAKDGGDHHGV